MFIPRNPKYNHVNSFVSRKSINGYLDFGLRIIKAKPTLYYHQTLTFPTPHNAQDAKKKLTTYSEALKIEYRKSELAIFYVQERSKHNLAIHFHLCFLFFGNTPPSYRHFRKDTFQRWNALNNSESVHPANKLIEHPFDLNSIEYFIRAVNVTNAPTDRPETNGWGRFNKRAIESRSTAPTKQERKAVFDYCFKKPTRRRSPLKMGVTQKRLSRFTDLLPDPQSTELTLEDSEQSLTA